MANAIVVPDAEVTVDLNLLRALNPKHYEDGLPGPNHFVMKLDAGAEDGVSTGIEALIKVDQMRGLQVIEGLCGKNCGVALLNVAEILEPVKGTEIKVIQQDAREWELFSHAHAIITGYQCFPSGSAGRKKIQEFRRHLVKLARRRYFPPGSTTEVRGD